MLKRKYHHIRTLRNNKHHSHLLQSAFNEYGENNFDFWAIKIIDESYLCKSSFGINKERDPRETEREIN